MRVERIDEFDPDVIAERLAEIYERTDEWLWFSTSLHGDFFSRDDIKERLVDLAESEVSIRILIDGQVDVDQVRSEVEYLFELENTEMKHAPHGLPHRVISDGQDIRLEKDHSRANKGAPNLIAYDVEGPFSDAIKQEFEDQWDVSEEVS